MNNFEKLNIFNEEEYLKYPNIKDWQNNILTIFNYSNISTYEEDEIKNNISILNQNITVRPQLLLKSIYSTLTKTLQEMVNFTIEKGGGNYNNNYIYTNQAEYYNDTTDNNIKYLSANINTSYRYCTLQDDNFLMNPIITNNIIELENQGDRKLLNDDVTTGTVLSFIATNNYTPDTSQQEPTLPETADLRVEFYENFTSSNRKVACIVCDANMTSLGDMADYVVFDDLTFTQLVDQYVIPAINAINIGSSIWIRIDANNSWLKLADNVANITYFFEPEPTIFRDYNGDTFTTIPYKMYYGGNINTTRFFGDFSAVKITNGQYNWDMTNTATQKNVFRTIGGLPAFATYNQLDTVFAGVHPGDVPRCGAGCLFLHFTNWRTGYFKLKDSTGSYNTATIQFKNLREVEETFIYGETSFETTWKAILIKDGVESEDMVLPYTFQLALRHIPQNAIPYVIPAEEANTSYINIDNNLFELRINDVKIENTQYFYNKYCQLEYKENYFNLIIQKD